MSQAQGQFAKQESHERAPVSRTPRIYNNPSRSKTLDSNSLESRYRAQRAAARATLINHDSSKPILRVDTVLGEWLHAAYFADTKSPPGSIDMLNAAMKELTLQSAAIQGATVPDSNGSSNPGTPPAIESHSPPKPSPLRMGSLTWNLPNYSESSGQSSSSSSSMPTRPSMRPRKSTSFYEPPSPNYAIANSEPIPQGFVAHARDLCVNVDEQWNSMQEPQMWGDGGSHDEEWRALHQRFRVGLASMVNWYTENSVSYNPQAGDKAENTSSEDEDTDVVLVLVTHSAGCNALIHAITNHPVLVDFQTASLTLATLKQHKSAPPSRPSTPGGRLHISTDSREAVLDEYEMRLVGSTDHLRTGVDISRMSPHLMATIPEANRRASLAAMQTVASPIGGSNPFDDRNVDRPHTRNAALGSMRRQRATSNALNQHRDRSASNEQTVAPSQGLWTDRRRSSAAAAATQDAIKSPEAERSEVISFTVDVHEEEEEEEDADDEVDLLSPLVSDVPKGGLLWGGGTTGVPLRRESNSSNGRRRAASEL
jgi:hypothetical protein